MVNLGMVYDCFTNITLYIYIGDYHNPWRGNPVLNHPAYWRQYRVLNTVLISFSYHLVVSTRFHLFFGGWLQITKQFSSKQPNSLRCTAWTDFTQIILSGALFARRIFGDVELYLSALHEGDSWGGSSESRLSNVDHPRFIKLSSVFPVFF